MYTQQSYIINNILMAVDATIIVVTGYYAYLISVDFRVEGLIMAYNDLLLLLVIVMFSCNYFMGKFGFYSEKRFDSTAYMIGSLFIAVLFAFIVQITGAVLMGVSPFSRVYLFSHFLAVLVLFVFIRVVLNFYLGHRTRTPLNSRQILLVGSHDRAMAVADALGKQSSWGHQIVGYLNGHDKTDPVPGSVPGLGTIADFDKILFELQIDEVVFTLPRNSPIKLDRYLKKCRDIGVAVRIVPALFNMDDPTLRVESIQGIPTLTDFVAFKTASGLLYKKILDLIAGTVGFIFLIFLYPIIGVAIKLDSSGPVFFKQVRVGTHGRRFYLYKFRSMVEGAESEKAALLSKSEMSGPMFKMEADPRLTRVGRFLRKTSLDEFPQFINVLKGEMSMVGTRPPTPDEVEQYIDWQRRRISIKPGITGLWQISGRNAITEFSEVVKLDLQYIDGWRFWRDIYIIFKTVWVVLARKGAK